MARLRIFVSSTCYDLDILRSELRPFISNIGYEPVMSDYSDVLYDPRSHTHDSCLKEVPSCDMVVLIIGSRYGGRAVPSALDQLDFATLDVSSPKSGLLETRDKLSITQLEVLKAVEQSIPVYAFVDEKVLHDYHVYERNKDKAEVIDRIEFPSIQNKEAARYIFEFINFITHRVINNSITAYTRLEEIRLHLTSQWSQLFQRLIAEHRTQAQEFRRYQDFSERIDDLKAVVLASISTPDLRSTAKGAIQYRRLIGFMSALRISDCRQLLLSDVSWDEILKEARITELRPIEDGDRPFVHGGTYLVLDDLTFYISRNPKRYFDYLSMDWDGFQRLSDHSREAIVDALLEDRSTRGFAMLRYVDEPFDEYLARLSSASLSREVSSPE